MGFECDHLSFNNNNKKKYIFEIPENAVCFWWRSGKYINRCLTAVRKFSRSIASTEQACSVFYSESERKGDSKTVCSQIKWTGLYIFFSRTRVRADQKWMYRNMFDFPSSLCPNKRFREKNEILFRRRRRERGIEQGAHTQTMWM